MKWWNQAQEGARQLHATSSHLDPLWQHYLPAVLNDQGHGDKLLDSSFTKDLWHHLPDSKVFATHSQK
eukprot:474721-Lingulodinium_polyedra.AAC.1